MIKTALCIQADSDLFRLGEVYNIRPTRSEDGYVHVETGNYFGDVLVCTTGCLGFFGARVIDDGNVYIFDPHYKERNQ